MKIKNIFKKEKKVKPATWHDITLRQFKQIQEFLAQQDEWTTLNLVNLIYNIDAEDLPVHKLKEYSLNFLTEKIPNVKINKTYTLNGTVYNSNYDLTRVTTAQFIDYQNYSKEEHIEINKLLSVFMIPQGYDKYNDGYDIQKVQEDILEMRMDDLNTIGFFFNNQLTVFITLFQSYLKQEIEEMEIEPMKKKEILDLLDNYQQHSSELFRMSSNIVK